jgi:hypothetical protein
MKAVGDYDFGWRVLLGRMSPTSSNGSSTAWHWNILSGLSWLAAQQDFGAKILCDNINALAVHAAE